MDAFAALNEVAAAAGIRVASIAGGAGSTVVQFTTEEGTRFAIDLAPIVKAGPKHAAETAAAAMRKAYEAAKQTQQ